MRTWEFDDTRASPTNLVLEQDFVLRLRRMNRLATKHVIALLSVNEIPFDYGGRGSIDEAHRRLEALTIAQKGVFAPMSNGDVFLIWPEGSNTIVFPDQALIVLLPHGVQSGDKERFMTLYNLPQDYTLLRARVNDYINGVKTIDSEQTDENSASNLLQSDAARGPLTAWRVNQIERLAKEIDLTQYIRSQSVYAYQSNESWQQLFDEAFIGVDELKMRYFPHTEVTQPKHLFLDLCQLLDRSLLEALTLNYISVAEMPLSLNLSIPTVIGKEFAAFIHSIPRMNRSRIVFEIHCGDLLQDFSLTMNGLATLHQEGFKIAIDGITPDMVGFFNFGALNADYIKINVGKDHVTTLRSSYIHDAIMKIPHDKIIFFHCDSDQAIKLGLEMGITKYQGFLIDNAARKWRKV
ncbi:MAG: EAL domain-containing protein [Alphaproteobacteria bacterium]|jgi:EAL domain-containing protein (putative c-di-GMP-specific phosphodiesterase class I)|nr:EAL domain-containing protein [Alphaproteobacteria bacterium]